MATPKAFTNGFDDFEDVESQAGPSIRPSIPRIDTQTVGTPEMDDWASTSPLSATSYKSRGHISPLDEGLMPRSARRGSVLSPRSSSEALRPRSADAAKPTLGIGLNRLPSYSKHPRKRSQARSWRIPPLSQLRTSRLARALFFFLFGCLVIYGLSRNWKKRKPSLKPKLFPQDLYSGTARREAQLRLSNPETIPYSELADLPSSIDPDDIHLNVSVLFIPLPGASFPELEAGLRSFNGQTKEPLGYHLLPALTSYTLAQTELANATMPTAATSQFTFVLPIGGPAVLIGPNILRYLLHLSGTREFSGALLELGCSQAALVQTSWLDKLNLALQDPPHTNRMTWRRRGLSAIRVPLVDSASGSDGFWVNGLQECEPEPAPLPPMAQGPGSIIFLVEEATRWERGWQDLVCEYVHRQASWHAEVLFLYERESGADLGCRIPASKKGRANVVEARVVDPRRWAVAADFADVVVYVADGAVDRQMKAMQGQSYTPIALPEHDLPAAVWIAALDVEALKQWHTPRLDLTVITNNRADSLDRLLSSMEISHYFGDSVHLTISMEQTADFATSSLLSGFAWPHGPYNLRRRIILGGLMPAIVESWYPTNNHSYGIFLEDDVEVSPLFYAWLKFTVLRYRYSSAQKNQATRLFGVSLYQPKNIELRPEGRQPFDAHILFEELALPLDTPYLSQVPCSWGAVYFPEIWREYHEYLAIRLSEVSLEIGDVVVPDLRSNRWPRSWKKYFNELVYLRGYTMLYPNYPNFQSFSTNHLERGTHVRETQVDIKKKIQFTVPLMPDSNPALLLELPEGSLPDWSNLPVLDLWGAVATEEEVIARGWSAVAGLATCAGAAETQPYKLELPLTYNPKELLCPREYEPSINLTSWEEQIETDGIHLPQLEPLE